MSASLVGSEMCIRDRHRPRRRRKHRALALALAGTLAIVGCAGAGVLLGLAAEVRRGGTLGLTDGARRGALQ
eukprot:1492031-Alexandrium_andersonii.AAC.1